MNIDILAISELKWTGIGELIQMTAISTTVGKNPLVEVNSTKNPLVESLSHIVNKSLKCSTWVQSQEQQNDLYLFPRQTIQYHSNPSLCPNH